MTLAMSGILLGLFTAWTQTVLAGSTQVAPFIKLLGGGAWMGSVPYSVLVWGGVALVVIWLLRRSGWGRLIYAIGDNETAVRLAGVRVWQVRLSAYMLSGVLGAIAGILLGGRTGAVDLQLAGAFLLPSVAAAVIGGTSIFGGVGGYTGTILGGAHPQRAQLAAHLPQRRSGDPADGLRCDRAGAGVGLRQPDAAKLRMSHRPCHSNPVFDAAHRRGIAKRI